MRARCVFLPAVLLAAALAAGEDAGKADPPAAATAPSPFVLRGRLVCLAEEMRDRYRAEVPPVHEHVLGLRVEEPGGAADAKPGEAAGSSAGEAAGAKAAGTPPYVSILRTPLSEGLLTDERFRGRALIVTGRLFPGTTLGEVSRVQWLKEGKLQDVYYWCEVCSIRTASPGPCACCQGKVELREAPAAEPPK